MSADGTLSWACPERGDGHVHGRVVVELVPLRFGVVAAVPPGVPSECWCGREVVLTTTFDAQPEGPVFEPPSAAPR